MHTSRRSPARYPAFAVAAGAWTLALCTVGGPVEAAGADPAAPPAAAPVAKGSLGRTMDASDRRHLVLRTGIGAAPGDLLALEGMTRAEGIAHVVAGLATEPSTPMPAWTREPPPHYHAWPDLSVLERQRFDRARDRELGELRLWWTREMLATPSPQTERLVLFWHDLFATSYHGTHRRSLAMARQNATFRRLATGSWRALLEAMVRDAALLEFLDNDTNRAASPNENLAREFLELFTLGEGRYTQRDVSEAARALTGHAASDTAGLDFRLRTWDHDAGDKTLFGTRGPHDGDALVRLVLERPAAARHLATRFWQAFVADGAPDESWLATAAGRFRESGHDIGVLYRHTLSSDAFWAPAHRGAIVRSPIDLAIGTARSLDYPKARWQSLPRWQADLGMDLFAPPDVAGWREGEAFVTSGSLLERARMVDRLVTPGATGAADAGSAMIADSGMAMGEEAETRVVANASPERGAGANAGTDVGARATPPLTVRLAAEHYRGAAAWRVSLLDDDAPVWTDLVRVLDNGHDTERDGRLGGAADRPWQDVAIPAPGDAVARADAVVVEFLNDTAGSDGDRNLYVDGARLAGVWLDATRGEQRSECVPENALDAGSLHCAGRVVLRRPDADVGDGGTAAAAPMAKGAATGTADRRPVWRAAAAHVRWANTEGDGDHHVAGIALDDVATPSGDFHRVQFRLVAPRDGGVELEIDNFDCVPDCVDDWPDCAWRDDGFPAARRLALPLDGDAGGARTPCHLESLGAGPRALVAALARSVPTLLAWLETRPSAEPHRDTLDALAARVAGQRAGWTVDADDERRGGPGEGGDGETLAGSAGMTNAAAAETAAGMVAEAVDEAAERRNGRFVVDAAFAPAERPPTRAVPPPVRASTPERLVKALDDLGLDLVDVLLAGFPDETVSPLTARPGDAAVDAIRRIVTHPAFQVR